MSPLPSPSYLNTMNFQEHTLPTIPSEAPSGAVELQSQSLLSDSSMRAGSMGPSTVLSPPQTPSRKRRATVVTHSPENVRKAVSLEIDVSPMKRREKSRSYGDLLRPITPVTKLEFELERREYIISTQRLVCTLAHTLSQCTQLHSPRPRRGCPPWSTRACLFPRRSRLFRGRMRTLS